jgi:hypothetical protein
MTTVLASLHRAHKERLKRLGALAPVIRSKTSATLPETEPPAPPSPPARWFLRMRVLQTCVAHVFDVPEQALVGPDRDREIVRARHAAMYLAHEWLGTPFREIGRKFGDRKHTTALNGYRHAQALMITDATFREKVERARAELRTSPD